MPAKSDKQRRFMGAELARKRAGKKPKKRKKLPTHGSGELSPIGQRVVAGYEDRWGKDEGHAKFEAAIKEGRVDRDKMFKRSAKGAFAART